MRNYRLEKKRCELCKFYFYVWEYDDGIIGTYCTHEAGERPLCDSYAMKELIPHPKIEFTHLDNEALTNEEWREKHNPAWQDYFALQDKWEAWAKENEIHQGGTCDVFEQKETER